MEPDFWGFFAVLTKALAYGGSLVAAGSVLFVVSLKPSPTIVAEVRRAGFVGAGAGAIATLAFLVVQAGYLLDDGLAGMVDPFALTLVGDGPLGHAAATRLAGLALVLVALIVRSLRVPSAVVGALLVAVSFALSGHATAEPRLALSAIITTHTLGISFWIGALWPLYRATNLCAQEDAADLAHRFGNHAMIVVPALIGAGALFTLLRVDPVTALATSTYGWTLLGKLLIVLGLLCLALRNRRSIVPAMQTGNIEGGAKLRRSIGWEAVVFAAILATTAVLTTLTPIPGASH
ncbi:MAG: CopD family protein [Hyphomicrobiales bacterium]|jgi:putative copper resistance protein D